MKDKKALNKLFSTIILLVTSIVFIYSMVIGVMGSYEVATLKGTNPGLAGSVALVLVAACVLIIIRLAKVTAPTLKNNSNKHLARASLAMDIISLVGAVALVIAFALINVLPTDASEANHVAILGAILYGAPFLFIGQIASYRMEKSAIK